MIFFDHCVIISAMFLAVDIGNTNINFGLFSGKKLTKKWQAATFGPWPKFKAKISSAIISSVVPSVNKKMERFLKVNFGTKPAFVTAGSIKGLKIKVNSKREVGADRLVGALAAYRLYGGPVIIIDFGTATTFDVVTKGGEYVGGAISPGIGISRDSLHEKTAKLPLVEIKKPKSVIGRSTVEAMRSGLLFGYASLVEGMIKRLKKEFPKARVVATGGFSTLISKYAGTIGIINKDLTLYGLMMAEEGRSTRRGK
ncbi:MAG: type III pantothenate kinase [Candidatus Saganbacteria bacterium]|nr:type III pantothenate kinase [Candidatus Saganbacteria bacterium]